MNEIVMESNIVQDEITDSIKDKFDYEFDGRTTTTICLPDFPESFSIGLIVGSSGSGKSTLLKRCFGAEDDIAWDNSKAVISNFKSSDDGIDKLCAVGFGSIPSWCKPYNVLSNGEKFRADLAMRLHDNSVIDEFTSVVNREVAKSCSFSVQKYIREHGLKNVVIASCHSDIIEYLMPDWVYNTDTCTFNSGRCLRRPPIIVNIRRGSVGEWGMFKKHHYLSGSINKSSSCYIAYLNNVPVAFVAVLAFPAGGIRNAWRESRLVVLPDFQGIGIGNSVSEAIAQMYVDRGCRYFSKTTNPRCGEHRDKSNLWKPTSHNHKKRSDYVKNGRARVVSKYSMKEDMIMKHATRLCYSHEYVGGVR